LTLPVPGSQDNSPLWKGFDKTSFSKVKYNGIHGNVWAPPKGNPGSDGGFKHIASPYPGAKPKKGPRIIANDLPAKTMSASSFDLPKRKNVIQINLPDSTTKTTDYSYNAYTTPAIAVSNLKQKASLHGIDSVSPRVLHGRFQDVDVSFDNKEVSEASSDALNQLRKVEKTAGALAGSLKPEPTNLNIPIVMNNKKDLSANKK
jgi:hypothetical protein